jgi:hypothetical protein
VATVRRYLVACAEVLAVLLALPAGAALILAAHLREKYHDR